MAKKSTKPKAEDKEKDIPDSAEGEQADYVVVARRYRPQQFAELVGHEAIAQTLSNAIRTNRLAQAYLFTGTRGVGKTTTARILAKALNCEQGPTITPCDKCESCRAIAAGEDIDVLEIDGASNNKVEEVRTLISNSQYRPQRSRFKIYIIDEVHMLTTSAFNALLKTLEEPPPHVKFIFATTEVQKLPAPILSRCQRFDLKGISREAIAGKLKEIVDREKREADPEALGLIARRAASSMRDAQSLLDQALAFTTDKLSLSNLQSLFGQASEDQVSALAHGVLGRDVPRTLQEFHKQTTQGVQIGELLDQLLELWRQFVIHGVLRGGERSVDIFDIDMSPFQDALKTWNADELLAGMDILVSTKSKMRGTGQTALLLELSLIRLCRLNGLVSVSELVKRLEGIARGETPAAASSRPMPSASRVLTPAAAPAPPSVASAPAAEAVSPAPKIEFKPETVAEVWSTLLSQATVGMRSALTQSTKQSYRHPNALVLGFTANNQSYRDICAEPSRQSKLEEMLRQVTGVNVSLYFELDKTEAKPLPKQMTGATLREAAARDPLVQAAMAHLDAQVMKADEGFGG